MDGNGSLSAAERRERRMKRILGDGENRIKKILSGPSGDEQRLPPMLEGGEYKFSALPNSENCAVDSNSTPAAGVSDTTTENKPEKCLSSLLCDSSIVSKIENMATPLNLLFGVCMRLLVMYGLTFNVLLPWILLFFGPRFLVLIHDIPKFITDVAVLVRSGNIHGIDDILKRCYAAVFFVQLFISRLLLMVCGYLFTHAGLIIFYQATSDNRTQSGGVPV
ncbi:hypothetical protein RB195_000559 [Necator americanus]|uniref:Uncharacterized protein n=1 Tax=Necator americanus TaxID=51031 RepID=A0ABR1DAB8_NECAM